MFSVELYFSCEKKLTIPIVFKCPACQLALTKTAGSYRCDNLHTFDVAREGYVNLLLVQQKRSRQPGDSDEMIKSRKRFLNQQYYQPLAAALVSCLADSANGFDQRLLDIGCGEGYYLQQLMAASVDEPGLFCAAGIDVSKLAVRFAAKQKSGAEMAVASAYALPFFSGVFDSLLSVFSPVSSDEAARVLAPGGHLIMVGPGEWHLSGLVSEIYEKPVAHEGNFQVIDEASEFVLEQQIDVKTDISVRLSDIADLLMMTPYYWHISAERKEKLLSKTVLETPLHFVIKIYSKRLICDEVDNDSAEGTLIN